MLWDEMRIRSIREKRPVGDLVNDAFRAYLEKASKDDEAGKK